MQHANPNPAEMMAISTTQPNVTLFQYYTKMIDDIQPHALCVTEHWQSCAQIEKIKLNNYNLKSAVCRDLGQHGGAAVYVKENVSSKVRDDINSLSQLSVVECAGVELNIQKTRYVIVSVYRPPNTDLNIFLTILNSILSLNIEEDIRWIIAGDFNIDILKDTKQKNDFTDLFLSHNFINVFSDVTRI